jgi:aspartate-semialdehyde dehydrogenase
MSEACAIGARAEVGEGFRHSLKAKRFKLETARSFFPQRSEGASAQALKAFLRNAPDVEPDERDTL